MTFSDAVFLGALRVKWWYPHNIFRIPTKNISCGYSLEAPQQGASKEYPQGHNVCFCGDKRQIHG